MRSREGSLFEEHALGKWQKEVSLWFTRGSDRSRKWFLQKICENKKNKDTALWDLILCTLDEDCLQSVLSGSSHRMISVYYDWDLEHEISPLLLEILTEKQRAGLQKVFLLHLLFFFVNTMTSSKPATLSLNPFYSWFVWTVFRIPLFMMPFSHTTASSFI